jgi:hypothetical protein
MRSTELRNRREKGPKMKETLDDRLFEALSGEMTPKFLATRDGNGIPNVVPIISIQPYNDRTLIFGNFLMWKTEKNLATDPRVGVAVLTEQLFGATIRGTFQGFQKVGEYADLISSTSHLRYNAYSGIRSAGSIRIEEISGPFQLSKLDILKGLVHSKVHRVLARKHSEGRKIMHPIVMEMFGRVVAVKVLGFVDDRGDPHAVPVMSLQPAAPDVMVFHRGRMAPYLAGLREGAEVAVCVITGDPVAWQVKGVYRETDETRGVVVLKEAYHASPPHMGRQIVPQEVASIP